MKGWFLAQCVPNGCLHVKYPMTWRNSWDIYSKYLVWVGIKSYWLFLRLIVLQSTLLKSFFGFFWGKCSWLTLHNRGKKCKLDFFPYIVVYFTHLFCSCKHAWLILERLRQKNRVDFNFFEYPIYREESHNECYTCFVKIRIYDAIVYKINTNRCF